MGRKIKVLTYAGGQYFSVFLNDEEVKIGISVLERELAALGLANVEITHHDNRLGITISLDGDKTGEEQSERIVNDLARLFPVIAEDDLVVVDDVFGDLRWDDELSRFEGATNLDHHKIDLFVEIPSSSLSKESLALPRQVIASWPKWKSMMDDAIIAELFAIYNAEWKAGDENAVGSVALAEVAFLSRIKPITLTVRDDKSCTIDYFADGMFQDHDIRADFTEAGVVSVRIE